ncbi:hypothetical protein PFISCL1PPCAC_13813, partial [Pristionchus fissidentatus]
ESEVEAYLLGAKCFYTVFAGLSALGVVCNSFLVYTTIRTKSLRAPCNVLIGACALFDVMHQIIPEMGVAAGTFTVFSIGIDRFLSIAVANKYRSMNVTSYLAVQFAFIFLYCAYNAFLIVFFYGDRQLICNMPSVYNGVAVAFWAYSASVLNVAAFVIYLVTWRLIKAHSSNVESSTTDRIFRTIVLVTIFDLGGWVTTQAIVATLNLAPLPPHKLLCYVCFASIFVNLGVAVKFMVYFFTRYSKGSVVRKR